MNDIAIIMTVHNRKKETLDCLEHLYQVKIPFDVYMTDDGSSDGTSEAIRERYKDVNIIEGDGSLFWNRGMHKSFSLALAKDYRFYLWLNDDTIVVNDFLEKLINFSVDEGERSILCGACVDNDNHSVLTYGGFNNHHRPLALSNSLQECAFASGNIFFIPRAVATSLGNLDYYYRHSMGDFDYAVRAHKIGIKIYQLPSFLGFCKRHYSIPKWRDNRYNIKQRFIHLYSPLGQNPFEFWHCDNKLKGPVYASYRFVLLHLRCAIPKIWGTQYYNTI